jgi:hypothetical protein
LEVQAILDNIRAIPEVMVHFPVPKEIAKLPRQWIINVTYTLVGEDFRRYIEAKIDSIYLILSRMVEPPKLKN